MKHSILILVTILLITLQIPAESQGQIEMCKGSGIHCMKIKYGDVTVDLVKGKGAPEVVIKSKS